VEEGTLFFVCARVDRELNLIEGRGLAEKMIANQSGGGVGRGKSRFSGKEGFILKFGARVGW